MRVKAYSVAAAFCFVAMVLAPQAAHAQVALGGTVWEADPDCIFDFVSFYADGTAKMVTIVDGGELKAGGTWAFDGPTLNVMFPDYGNGSLVGTFNNAALEVRYKWTDNENDAHSNLCTLTKD